jgi:N6-L-threonylcarbamoyladenine synthase|tara:strand:- start:10 stop:1017 length:1008 start_codon:yes stop_codon:yes gene_type:complete
VKILGIDTSCDDTSVAVVEDGKHILSNVISSQFDLHEKYGGIVPELASRKHIESINYIIDQALAESEVSFQDLTVIAVTNRPGLIGALLIGLSAAKALAFCHNLPLIGINHIEGHVYANFMQHDELTFPHICLTVSGGHTLLLKVNRGWTYQILGSTIDDAAGEAYDKVAQYLGLGFPGGRIIDDMAGKGNDKAIDFPRPLIDRDDYNFSFSGLKTSVRYFVEKARKAGNLPPLEDIAASFQVAVVDVLVKKTIRAAQEYQVKSINLTGGVAANSRLRCDLRKAADKNDMHVFHPPIKLCTDNAAMVAGVAYQKYQQGQRDGLDLNASANSDLGQ